MDKVWKPSNSVRYTPSSEPYRIYILRCFLSPFLIFRSSETSVQVNFMNLACCYKKYLPNIRMFLESNLWTTRYYYTNNLLHTRRMNIYCSTIFLQNTRYMNTYCSARNLPKARHTNSIRGTFRTSGIWIHVAIRGTSRSSGMSIYCHVFLVTWLIMMGSGLD
jgi:hypothetical protein